MWACRRWSGILFLVGKVTVLLFLFYRSWLWVSILGTPLILWGYRELGKQQNEKKKWQLNLQFREGLQGIAVALNAGYSIENALEESKKDLEVLYGKNCLLCQEFQIMQGQLHLNQPMETVWEDFAKRSDVEDIRTFAEIFRTARRTGGDLVEITRNCARQIGEKIEVEREIKTMLAGKQMEGAIMNIVPLGMILYFWICSPGFLDCLYEGIWGHMVMSVLLVVYLVAYRLNQKICRIKI